MRCINRLNPQSFAAIQVDWMRIHVILEACPLALEQVGKQDGSPQLSASSDGNCSSKPRSTEASLTLLLVTLIARVCKVSASMPMCSLRRAGDKPGYALVQPN